MTVDMVVLTVVDLDLKILLIRRGEAPFLGQWALPGGFVRVNDAPDQGEDVDAAAIRELREETGLRPEDVYLHQLRAFGRAGRDPRYRVISVAYYALVAADRVRRVVAGDDAAEAEWFSTSSLETMALGFDHPEIIDAALEHIADRIDGDFGMAASLVPAAFTKAELRRVYEIVTGQSYDKSNFNKRFNRMLEDGLLLESPGRRAFAGPGRPASLYAFNLSADED
ncbi:MAG: NUDIX hydrolase [Nannocystaceae bacterium]|nr:NUDIX hydrolase [Nannocystaceae bacterium]